jgi:hypothetical protein
VVAHAGSHQVASDVDTGGPAVTTVVLATFALALLLRVTFFEGLWPADAVHYVKYAAEWNHLPQSHWETRLLYIGSLHLTIQSFGCSEGALALPSLIPSLATSLVTVLIAAYALSARAALFAGLVTASLPVDVAFATVPLPGCLATFFITAGVGCLLVDDIPARDFLGPFTFVLAIFTHLTTVFLIGFVLGTAFLLASNPRERRRAVAWFVAAAIGYCAIEFLTYWWLTRDPFYEFRIIPKTSPRLDPSVTTFSAAWFAWPVLTWIISKDFGLATLSVSILWFAHRQSTPRSIRILLGASVAFWVWIGYGTQSPFEFRPFWRSARFAQTFAAPLALTLGFYLARLRRLGMALAVFVTAVNVLLIAASGPWGQDVEINKELLPAIRSTTNVAFITDAATRDQLYVLNGCRYLDNVFTSDDLRHAQFDRYGTIVNPLGSNTMPVGYLETSTLATTSRHYRSVAYLVPSALRTRIGWFERRPPGRLVEIVPALR